MSEKIVNFPVADNRVSDFAEKLEQFVHDEAQNISLLSVIGALETVKLIILAETMVD